MKNLKVYMETTNHVVTLDPIGPRHKALPLCNVPTREDGYGPLYTLNKPHMLINSLALSSSLRAKGSI